MNCKDIALLFYLSLCQEALHSKPIIVLIQGACSSGKSTLCSALKKISPNITHINEKKLVLHAFPHIIKKRFPRQYTIISKSIDTIHIFNAIVRRDIFFLNGTNEYQKKQVIHAIAYIEKKLNKRNAYKSFRNELIVQVKKNRDKIIQKSINNKNHICIESWIDHQNYYKKNYPTYDAITVFAHCPLPQAFPFFKKRNQEALPDDPLNKRWYAHLVKTHLRYYNYYTEATEYTVEKEQKNSFEKIFDEITLCVSPYWEVNNFGPFSQREINRFQLQQLIKKKFTDKLSKAKAVYIEPHEPKDYIIKTGQQAPVESALQLLEIIKHHSTL